MALTIAQQGAATVPGAASRKTLTITGDASYPNPSGYVVTPAQVNWQRFTKIENPVACSVAAGAWDPVVVPTYASDGSDSIVSFALHLVVQTTGVEVANGTSVTNAKFTVYVEGN